MQLNNSTGKLYPGIKQTIEIGIIYILAHFFVSWIVSFFKLTQPLQGPLVFTISISIIILYAYKRTCETVNAVFKLRGFNILIIAPLMITLLGLSPIISEIGNLTKMLVLMPKSMNDALFSSIRPDKYFWIPYLKIIVIGPIAEELLFRGIILRAYLKRYSSVKAIIVSSIFFGIYHLSIWQLLGAIIIGCFFAWLFFKTGSLFLCMIAHTLVNSISILAIEMQKQLETNNIYFPSKFHPCIIDVIGILLVGIGIWWLVKIFKKK